ncbi:MAG: class I SAM-dependent methyltransferase [Pseudomonadota bacterium]
MQKTNRDFLEICISHLPFFEPVYEFGALQVSGSEDENLRSLFPNTHYIGADMRSGLGVDRVLNLHSLELEDDSVGSIVCLDTLEHVEMPRTAVNEMFRVLKPGGVIAMSSVFEFPIHGYPNDYWRFTPEGFRSLMKPFSRVLISSYGQSETRPQNVVGVGIKGEGNWPRGFEAAVDQWSRWNSGLCRKLAEDAGKERSS